ncbi:MAG: hypothetical protein ACD_9C00095G0004 [uncultured bacterium]|nr:MAG: hypothetical protein ACD_9C00095G0004 [uncultured bacterium]
MNKIKKFTIALSFLTITSSIFAWLSLQRAVVVADSSTWGVPMILFSIFITLICLDIIIFKEAIMLELVLFASLATSIFFAFGWTQLIAVLISAYFLFLALRRIRSDVETSTKISPWKSLHTGKSYLLISLAFLISMQYFANIRSFDGEKKAPNFDATFITKKIVIPFISSVDPQFEVLKDETMTVDQFILQTQNSTQGDIFSGIDESMLDAQLPADLNPAQREAIKKQAMESYSSARDQVSQKNEELILSIGRKQFSEVVGTPVKGDEKISEIFAGLINNKIDNFNPSGGEENSSIFLIVFAVALFLIVYPLGSILSIIWFLVVRIIIMVLIRFKVFNVKIISVDREILE